MRVRLFEETDFSSDPPAAVAPRNRVLAAWFDDRCCIFSDHAEQLDNLCLTELGQLMYDLCVKARSGLPIAECYGADEWRHLGDVSFRCGSDVITVPTFRLSRRNVAVVGFVARNTHIVVYACLKKRASLKKADEDCLEGAIRAFCESQRLNTLFPEQ